jgi:hypothetical protein
MMGNFLIILGFMIIISAPLSVYASELLGRISTVPLENIEAVADVPPAVRPVTTNTGAGSAAANPGIPGPPPPDLTAEQPAPTEKTTKILGQKIYPDDSLVRDGEGRIFLIQGQVKKPVRNLDELGKYRGQTILRVDSASLGQYQTREHLTGELIRQKNDVKIYALKKGPKYHILNLAELAKYYFGLPIYNLEPEEMKNYL